MFFGILLEIENAVFNLFSLKTTTVLTIEEKKLEYFKQ